MIIANIICYVLLLIGGINWGIYGICEFNLVGAICGGNRNSLSILIYILVGLAAVWLIISPCITGDLLLR